MNPYLLPFEDFFTYLKQQGFALGVSDFLQVQSLLNRLPADCPPERLKRLLCPLIASNQEEQTLFYEAFDRYFADMALESKAIPNRNTQTKQKTGDSKEEDLGFEENEWAKAGDAFFQKYGDKTTFTFWGFITSRLTWVGGFFGVDVRFIVCRNQSKLQISANHSKLRTLLPSNTH